MKAGTLELTAPTLVMTDERGSLAALQANARLEGSLESVTNL